MSAVKTAGAVGGLGSAAAVIAAVGWPGVAVVIALIALPLAGMLWVLNSLERCHRLVLVITAVRGGGGLATASPVFTAIAKTLDPRPAEHGQDPPAEPR
jgi:hypothetical protein